MAVDHNRPVASEGTMGSADSLVVVREAAEAALERQAAGDEDAEQAVRLTAVAKAALDAGHGLAAIAAAETAGKDAARSRLRAEVLRDVSRSAKKKREAAVEHDAAVARAATLGLGAREIAERAGVAHGTVAAIVRRQAKDDPATVAAIDSTVDGAAVDGR